MPIRITGLNSGLDTESIISALVSSYNYKTQKYEKAQTKLSWKQDAWKELNAKVYSLYKNVGNLRWSSAYNLRKATVSDPSKATVTANSGVVNGSYSVQVTQLAKTGYLTGAVVENKMGTSVTTSTTLSELGYTGEGSFTVKAGDGKEQTITVNGTTKISDVVSKLQEAGVNASFDAKNKRFFISAKEAGEANDFTIDAGITGVDALKALGIYENKEIIGSEAKGADGNAATADSAILADGANASFKIIVDGKETEIKVKGADLDADGNPIADTATTIDDVIGQLNAAGVNASFEDGKFVIRGAKADSDFSITGIGAEGEALLGQLGIEDKEVADEGTGRPIRIEGQGSIIYVNGAKFEGDTNTVTVNGLSIQATGVTGDAYDPTGSNAINVEVSTDAQGIYDKIKDFLSQYNSLINEMTKLYNADSAKGYEPLTDEEKDSMSEAEVEKWETKIKDSILRRDDTLSSLISVMSNAMSKTYQVDGKTYSLSSFGIQTLGILNAAKNEHNAYHIDGDEDDANTSGKTDKLMAALNEDPDSVIDFMKELSTGLYEAVDTKMKTTTLSSVYTVYNDKEMASEYSDYTSTIRKWQERLEQQEEYYYNKFAAMETALAKLNSQTSSLSGLFGA